MTAGTPRSGQATAVLRDEHEVILRALTILERVGERLGSGQAVDGTALVDLVAVLRAFADRCHHAKEEDLLFPALERKGLPRELGPIGVMLGEHEQGRAYLAALSGTAPAAERGAAALAYVGLLRAHIEKENLVLFPMADELLSPAEQAELARAYEEAERRVLGAGGREQLSGTLDRLEATIPD